jgi:hypothetical protein
MSPGPGTQARAWYSAAPRPHAHRHFWPHGARSGDGPCTGLFGSRTPRAPVARALLKFGLGFGNRGLPARTGGSLSCNLRYSSPHQPPPSPIRTPPGLFISSAVLALGHRSSSRFPSPSPNPPPPTPTHPHAHSRPHHHVRTGHLEEPHARDRKRVTGAPLWVGVGRGGGGGGCLGQHTARIWESLVLS